MRMVQLIRELSLKKVQKSARTKTKNQKKNRNQKNRKKKNGKGEKEERNKMYMVLFHHRTRTTLLIKQDKEGL